MLLMAVEGQAKVCQLQDALIKQYVLWLDVPAAHSNTYALLLPHSNTYALLLPHQCIMPGNAG
jgi:hypothetical protein